MSNPAKICNTCNRVRDCTLHLRAGFPPDAAEKWLRRTCQQKDRCDITYCAGLGPRGRVVGQNESEASDD